MPNGSVFMPFCLEFPPYCFASHQVIFHPASLQGEVQPAATGGTPAAPHHQALARSTSKDARKKGPGRYHISNFPAAFEGRVRCSLLRTELLQNSPSGSRRTRRSSSSFHGDCGTLRQDFCLISCDGSSIHYTSLWCTE